MEEISIGDSTDETQFTSLHVCNLPDSLLLQIFSFLEANDVVRTAHVCTRWRVIAYDESLWRQLVYRRWKMKGKLAPHRFLWRHEYQRLCDRVPNVLSETLTEHTDEVLHVSFSHSGHLFSTTSKDCTIKVWNVGFPTTLKYSHDFRAHFHWDFTQFSCFNAADTMLLVSSVKTAELDRRGYVAVLSITYDFQLLQVVSMDPSQLFGTWLDTTTFLGGSLEISLDRFITTVQIQAFQIQDVPFRSKNSVGVETHLGQTLFTFCSENASLIKFLTVVNMPCVSDSCTRHQIASSDTQQISDSLDIGNWCHSPNSSYSHRTGACEHVYGDDTSEKTSACVAMCDVRDDDENTVTPSTLCLCCKKEISKKMVGRSRNCDIIKLGANGDVKVSETNPKCYVDIHEQSLHTSEHFKDRPEHFKDRPEHFKDRPELFKDRTELFKDNLEPSEERLEQCTDYDMKDIVALDKERLPLTKEAQLKLDEDRHEHYFNVSCDLEDFDSDDRLSPFNHNYCDTTIHPSGFGDTYLQATGGDHPDSKKNLIYVTGEFAVALHQLGFKALSVERTPDPDSGDSSVEFDFENTESHMVVNYSNQLIEMQQVRKPDPFDHMIDLHGHITGLCLSKDHRYLFVNCRPWVGTVDRSDPWATPELSSEIEVRIIDLTTMEVSAGQYVGHKGLSPSTMCCFIFLDTSQDFVGSGSEDSNAYIWERHYRCIVGKLPHGPGVVNAVGFCPTNQEYLVTVSDDNIIRIWRSCHSMRQNIPR